MGLVPSSLKWKGETTSWCNLGASVFSRNRKAETLPSRVEERERMAWLVSVKLQPFSGPARVLPSRWEPHPKMPAQHVVSSLTAKRVVNILLSACKQKTALSQDGFRVTVSSRQLFAPVSKRAHVSCCPRTLTGYWIGPDSEDGWGFAVAFIDKIL